MVSSLNFNAELVKVESLLRQRELLHAHRILEGLYAQHPRDPRVLAMMATVAVEQSRLEDAVALLQKCIDLQPKTLINHLELAAAYTNMGKHRQAIARLEKAQRLAPGDLRVIARLADSQERAGEPERAREILEPLLRDGRADAYLTTIWAKTALTRKEPEEAFRVLEPFATPTANYPGAFWFIFGQACERTNRLEQAFAAYCRGNARAANRFDLDEHIRLYDRIIRAFNRRTLARLPRPSHDTSTPIFVAGRPRSGTTLIEKILDAHPQVVGVGELPHLTLAAETLGFEIGSVLTYPEAIGDLDAEDVTLLSRNYLENVRRLAGGVRHTVDKNLENYNLLGMVQILLPQSRAIHVRRDPVDNCWAIFVADMIYAWTQDLRTLGITHALYERLMRHWHEVLDLPILDIDYEAVVDDLEGSTRRMLEFCGLPWDDRCLRYYETSAKSKESVSAPTLSYNQVRQPIYKTSVGRSSKFSAFLQPLRDGLAEGADIAAKLGT